MLITTAFFPGRPVDLKWQFAFVGSALSVNVAYCLQVPLIPLREGRAARHRNGIIATRRGTLLPECTEVTTAKAYLLQVQAENDFSFWIGLSMSTILKARS